MTDNNTTSKLSLDEGEHLPLARRSRSRSPQSRSHSPEPRRLAGAPPAPNSEWREPNNAVWRTTAAAGRDRQPPPGRRPQQQRIVQLPRRPAQTERRRDAVDTVLLPGEREYLLDSIDKWRAERTRYNTLIETAMARLRGAK